MFPGLASHLGTEVRREGIWPAGGKAAQAGFGIGLLRNRHPQVAARHFLGQFQLEQVENRR
jgi:hypothetical protein